MNTFLDYAKNLMFFAWDEYPANTVIYSIMTLIGLITILIGLYDVRGNVTFTGIIFVFIGCVCLLYFSETADFLPRFDKMWAPQIFFLCGIFGILFQCFVLYDEYAPVEEEGDPRENTF